MKKPYHIYLKKILFSLILGCLFMPLIQQNLHIFDLYPLNGSYIKREDPYISTKSWLSGEYQTQQQEYFNENFGFRTLCVKLNNQIAYIFFNYAKANGVIIGKDDYLYEENYIKAYFGEDFIGKENIIDNVYKLKKVKDTLGSKNIDLIVVLAPGKGTFYPEYIPDNYYERKTITNYTYYLTEFERNKINYLDFNQWFLQMKDTSAYTLYSKTGIHWSKYGELLAADSIVKYIGTIRNIKMPQIQIENIETSSKMRDTDDDIEKGMNLLFNISDLEMGYPSFKVVKDSNTTEPRVLTVADSYYWGMFNWGLSRDVFKGGQFWFYNQQIYPDSYEKSINVSEINIRSEVEKNDVIMLMATDANLFKFPFGFIDQLYDAYFNNERLSSKKHII